MLTALTDADIISLCVQNNVRFDFSGFVSLGSNSSVHLGALQPDQGSEQNVTPQPEEGEEEDAHVKEEVEGDGEERGEEGVPEEAPQVPERSSSGRPIRLSRRAKLVKTEVDDDDFEGSQPDEEDDSDGSNGRIMRQVSRPRKRKVLAKRQGVAAFREGLIQHLEENPEVCLADALEEGGYPSAAAMKGVQDPSNAKALRKFMSNFRTIIADYGTQQLVKESVRYHFQCSVYVILVPNWHSLREALWEHLKRIGVRKAKRSVSTKKDLVEICVQEGVQFDFSAFAKDAESHGNRKRGKWGKPRGGSSPSSTMPSRKLHRKDPIPLSEHTPVRDVPASVMTTVANGHLSAQMASAGGLDRTAELNVLMNGTGRSKVSVNDIMGQVTQLDVTDLHKLHRWLSVYIARMPTVGLERAFERDGSRYYNDASNMLSGMQSTQAQGGNRSPLMPFSSPYFNSSAPSFNLDQYSRLAFNNSNGNASPTFPGQTKAQGLSLFGNSLGAASFSTSPLMQGLSGQQQHPQGLPQVGEGDEGNAMLVKWLLESQQRGQNGV